MRGDGVLGLIKNACGLLVRQFQLPDSDGLGLVRRERAVFGDLLLPLLDALPKVFIIVHVGEIARERVETGKWQGGIPYGLEMDKRGEYLVADEGQIDEALNLIACVEDGRMSKRAAAREIGVTHPTSSKILDRREAYRAASCGAKIGGGFSIIWHDDTTGDY